MRQPSTDRRAQPASEGLVEQVQDALAHLSDPVYLQTHLLARLATSAQPARPSSLGRSLRQALEEGIEALKPATRTPELSHAWRGHEILRLRYLEGLDVRSVADRLAIGRSEYYRDHRRAVEAVAGILAERWGVGEGERAADATDAMERRRVESAVQGRGERTTITPPNNLPHSLSSFVGREREIAEVRRLLGEHRLVTLTGSGGSGKTRLALEVARGLLEGYPEDYPDGVWLVELASLADPSLVSQTVALALGVRDASDRPILQSIVDQIGDKHLPLVLDNCEHLVEISAHVAEALLRACPHLVVLATSREPLGIVGEAILPVPSLDVPSGSWSSLEELSRNESVRLFLDRAKAARPSLTLTAENAPAVERICRLTAGLPLALELAAARVRALTLEQIGERLGNQLELLTCGSRTALPRQQTLKATIDWSFDLLAEPERALFRRLAVFAGGFTLEAAEKICSGEQVDARQVLDLLTSLVDKSLVQVEVEGGDARYTLLEPIRQYAQDRLEESGESDVVRARHRNWHLELAEEAESHLHGPEQRVWLDRLEVEHDNLRAALGYCLELEGDGTLGLRLAASLGDFWWLRSYYREGRQWLQAVLDLDPERTASRAQALGHLGRLARQQDDYDSAASHFVESLSISRQIEDRRSAASTLFDLGSVAEAQGDPGRAGALFQESLTLSREVGDDRGLHFALSGLGSLAVNQGELERARPLLDEALRLALKLGDRSALGWTTTYVAKLAGLVGETERARDLYEQSLAHFREIGERQEVGWVLLELARLAVAQGDSARAAALLAESLAIGQDLGDRVGAALSLYVSATFATKEGKLQRAARLAGAADLIPTLPFRTEKLECHKALETSRAVLGEVAFERAFAEGQAMTLEEAVEYALQEDAGE